MGYALKKSSTEQPLVFLMLLASDHLTGATGLSPTVTISQNGGAFATPAGAVSEIANGWYKVAGNATDTGTLGPLLLHATASTADPADDRFDVVAYDPQSATNLGLSALPTANPAASGGLPTCDANNNIHGLTPGTGTGQLNPASGKVPSTLAAGDVSGNLPSDLQTIKTEAVTCAAPVTVPATISSYAGGAVASVTGPVGSVTAGVTLAASQPNYAPALASAWTSDLATQLGSNVDATVSSRMQSLDSVATITRETVGTDDVAAVIRWDFSASLGVDISLTVNGHLLGNFTPSGTDADDATALDNINAPVDILASVVNSVATITFPWIGEVGGPVVTAVSSGTAQPTITTAGSYGTYEVQRLVIANATGGTFDLDSDAGGTWGTFAYNCAASDIQAFFPGYDATNLGTAPSAPGVNTDNSIVVTGSEGNFLLTWSSGATGPQELFTVDGSALTGGTPASAQNVSDTQSAITSALASGVALTSTGLNAVLVDGKTVPQALQIIGATTASKVSGVGTGTETFKGLDGTTTRVVVTVDSSGNRTAVAYD